MNMGGQLEIGLYLNTEIKTAPNFQITTGVLTNSKVEVEIQNLTYVPFTVPLHEVLEVRSLGVDAWLCWK